jgi:hypothetical protein
MPHIDEERKYRFMATKWTGVVSYDLESVRNPHWGRFVSSPDPVRRAARAPPLPSQRARGSNLQGLPVPLCSGHLPSFQFDAAPAAAVAETSGRRRSGRGGKGHGVGQRPSAIAKRPHCLRHCWVRPLRRCRVRRLRMHMISSYAPPRGVEWGPRSIFLSLHGNLFGASECCLV